MIFQKYFLYMKKLYWNLYHHRQKQLVIDYIKYQIEKKEYALRITDYMKDYNSVYKQQETNNPNSAYGGWNWLI